MNDQNNHTFPIVILLLFLVFVFGSSLIDSYRLNQNNRYTIGVILKITPDIDSGPEATYYIRVNGDYSERFISTSTKRHIKVGQRYFVRFEPDNISNTELLINKPVPDSIQVAPPDGWAKLPIE